MLRCGRKVLKIEEEARQRKIRTSFKNKIGF
jgi:hypothetical protein